MSDSRGSKPLTGAYAGDHKEKYQEFTRYVQAYLQALSQNTPQDLREVSKTLGAVSDSPDHYFDPNQEVRDYAKDFFTAFWADSENVEALDKYQDRKYKEARRRVNSTFCISFVATEVESSAGLQNICFIAISWAGQARNQDLWRQIKDFIQNNDLNTRYELVDMASHNFHELIVQTLGEMRSSGVHEESKESVDSDFIDPTRECAEKGFSTELIKLFFERALQGRNIKINGVLNCSFYPYEKDHYEEDSPKSKLKHVISPQKTAERNGGKILELDPINDKTYCMPILTCCSACQEKKWAIIYATLAAQSYGKLLAANAPSTPQKVHLTSPHQVKITPQKKRWRQESQEEKEVQRESLSDRFSRISVNNPNKAMLQIKEQHSGSDPEDKQSVNDRVFKDSTSANDRIFIGKAPTSENHSKFFASSCREEALKELKEKEAERPVNDSTFSDPNPQ